jgi:hypothetical protein
MDFPTKLERVEVFKYLGWLLAYNDNNTQAMGANLAKARKSWGQVSCVFRAENALPKVCGMFYKATVQAVLIFGSESWKLSPSSLKILEGFHIRAACHMQRAHMESWWDMDVPKLEGCTQSGGIMDN